MTIEVLMIGAAVGLMGFFIVVAVVSGSLRERDPGTRAIVWAIFWATFYMSAVVASAVWFLVYGVG